MFPCNHKAEMDSAVSCQQAQSQCTLWGNSGEMIEIEQLVYSYSFTLNSHYTTSAQ